MENARTVAHHFLREHHLATLSTVSSDGHPWGAAIYVVPDEDLNFFFMTHVKSRKYRNLKANPHVALTIADDQAQQTIQIAGVAEELSTQSPELDKAFRKLATLHAPGDDRWRPPVSKLDDSEAMVFRIVPSIVQFSSFQNNEPPFAEIAQLL